MKKNKGFTLLIAIVVTSIMLLVSFVVTNIALKQIVLADAGVESQYAFYNADSGADCAIYWDLVNSGSSAFATSTTGNITCGSNSNITTGNQTIQTVPTQLSLIGGGGISNPTSIFQLDYTKGCAIVSVTKFDNGNTTVSSKGYNTCDVDAIKRYERGITITYVGNNNTIFGESGNASSIGHIQLSTGSMSFSANTGATPASQNLTIQNTGTNALNWTASTNQSWCHISSSSGAIGSGSQTIVAISVDSQASAGTYNCVVTISSVDSDNSPQAVAVTDTVSSGVLAYSGTPVSIPGQIEAENYDIGGQGTSYNDDDVPNNGGVYRTDRVDLWGPEDGSYVVGWVHAGEWLNYAVNVTSAGTYTMTARVASAGAGGTFHVEMDGTNVSGTMTVPNTGAWSTYAIISAPVTLTAGDHTMKIVMDSNGATTASVGNINWIKFTSGAFTVDISGTLTTSLISYWKLSDSAGHRADSKGSNNLTNFNTVTSVAGKVGNASSFSSASSQYLGISDNASMSTGGIDFTISAWVNISDDSTRVIASKYDDTGTTKEWRLIYKASVKKFAFSTTDSGNTVTEIIADTPTPITLGSWYFVVAWRNQSSGTINVQVNNGTVYSLAASAPVDTSAAFKVGWSHSTTWWNGKIDEVGWWKKVLSTQERTDLYNAGTGSTYNP